MSIDLQPFIELLDYPIYVVTTCKWHRGAHGMPLLDDAAGWFVGEIIERFDVGDHQALLLAPVAVGAAAANGRPSASLMSVTSTPDTNPNAEDGEPAGSVWFAIAAGDEAFAEHRQFGSDPE
jgi:hypothetical protein